MTTSNSDGIVDRGNTANYQREGSDFGIQRISFAMENLKFENEMLKSKHQSYATLNTFYHETRQEIASLKQHMDMKENTISDLKSRLGRYEKTAVHLEGEKPLVFGPSKSLFENLCQEIAKLKKRLKDAQTQSSRQTEVHQQEIAQLQQMLRERDQELAGITRRPQHQKDQEIQRLQHSLKEKERVQATRDMLCTSLVMEAEQLRTQLGATIGVCQELLRRLEGKRREGGSEEDHVNPKPSGECTKSANTASLNSRVCELQEENEVLKRRVAYVESLNAKWQKYDLSREEYVKGLCQRLKGPGPLEGNLGPANTPMMQQEILRLNRQLEEKMVECARAGRELEDVRKRNGEHILMLEQQVLTYVDDFKSERADRERAQSKIQDLEEEVMRLKLRLRPQDGKDSPGACRVHAGCRKATRPQTDAAVAIATGNSPGVVTEPSPREADEQPGKRRVSGQPMPMSTSNRRVERRGVTDLQCPRCLAAYGEDQIGAFLAHCSECANL